MLYCYQLLINETGRHEGDKVLNAFVLGGEQKRITETQGHPLQYIRHAERKMEGERDNPEGTYICFYAIID